MRNCLLCATLLLCLFVAQDASATSCSQDTICVATERDGDQLYFIVRNLKPYPVTVSLRIEGEHLEPSGATRVSRTIGPNEEARVESFDIQDPRTYNFRYWYDWTIGELAPDVDDGYVYRLPYESGAAWPVLQGFHSSFSHHGLEAFGIDFDMPEGTPVHAARGGVVARVVERHDRGCWRIECGQYANFIVILHDDGTTGEYFHLRQDGAVVAEGERVERGQLIGYSGNTGHSSQPHLHFAVYRATEQGHTQSLPVQFETDEGLIVSSPERGAEYVAVG